ncbi:hypothetical protein L6164_014883 [Bauhinia variegata]|uniref:Uncharacterized protein n=1 Tax=Bauhinia variegata TaxID=167791 RepID=A0ACB9NMG5_BAUVA|nr:hypothetical protein L6164_014883 [Bauhinia variegata]
MLLSSKLWFILGNLIIVVLVVDWACRFFYVTAPGIAATEAYSKKILDASGAKKLFYPPSIQSPEVVCKENLARKVVLITGAASGIGEQLAYEYARRGAFLSLVDIREDNLGAVTDKARSLGSPQVITIGADVTKVQDCKQFVDETVNHFGRLDHLVNNAGILRSESVEKFEDVSLVIPMMDINFWGAVYGTLFAIPHLKSSEGKVVVVASAAGWYPVPRLSIYNASKAAVISFFETLRIELGWAIGITIITPGVIRTPLATAQTEAMGRMGFIPMETASECAKAIVESASRGDMRGAILSLVDIREDNLGTVADKARSLGSPQVITIGADVTKVQDCKQFVDETVNHFGRLNHLVNNAGIIRCGTVENVTDVSLVTPVMDVNFWGAVYGTLFAIPHLKSSKGKVVMIASSAAWYPLPRLSIYNASKAAAINFFETLRAELGWAIGVTIVTPGVIKTPLADPQTQAKARMGFIPMETAGECAKAIVKGVCRGDMYVTEPSWVKVFYHLKLLFPEVVDFGNRLAFRFGYADALQFSKLSVCKMSADKARSLGSPQVITIGADVTKVQDCKQFVDETANHFGRLDHLVNNAGILRSEAVEDIVEDVSTVTPMMDINFWGAVYGTLFAIPHLKSSKGKAVVVASGCGWFPIPRLSIYNASKAAAINFFETLRIELGWVIGITIVTPGVIETPLVNTQTQAKARLGFIPMGTASECAKAIVEGVCRGDMYVTEPSWVKVFHPWKMLFPEALDFASRVVFGLDHLVNNAGILRSEAVENIVQDVSSASKAAAINLFETLRTELGWDIGITIITTDVSSVQDCKRFVDIAVNHFGRLDHLVNNAGIVPMCLFEDITDITKLAPVMDINFWGQVYGIYFAIPHLRKSKGKIIGITSSSGWLPAPRLSFYNASKAALISLYECLRSELGSKIGITIVTPGLIEPEMTQGKFLSKEGQMILDQEMRDVEMTSVPVKSVTAAAKAIVNCACRGDPYLTEPAWVSTTFYFKILCPEIVERSNRLVLIPASSKSETETGRNTNTISKRLLDLSGLKKYLYPGSIRSPHLKST